MGPGEANADDGPAHPVILTKGFYLGKYEVTQEEYEKVIGNNPSRFKGAKLPVEGISWNDAIAFCARLNQRGRLPRGLSFSLPTEAQWEYACRAASKSNYSWGNNINPDLANYSSSGFEKTVLVGSYQQNPWGFFDMHGNVREWTFDFRGIYKGYLVTDPVGSNAEPNRASRGGSWNVSAQYVKIGRLVFVNIYVTYPTTSNGSTASIGGFPFAADGYSFLTGRTLNHGANDMAYQLNGGSATLHYNNNVRSNANLSNAYVLISGCYPTSQ